MGEIVFKYDNQPSQDLPVTAATLSCICTEETLSYAIGAPRLEDFLHVRTLRFDERYPSFARPLGYLSECLKQDPLLFRSFAKVVVGLRGVQFNIRYDDSSIGDVFDIGPKESLLNCKALGQHFDFVVPEKVVDEVHGYFGNAKICHSLSALATVAEQFISSDYPVSCIAVHEHWLEIVVVSDGGMLFCNHYKWHHDEDLVYFIAAVIDSLKIDDSRFVLLGSAMDEAMYTFLTQALNLSTGNILSRDSWGTRFLDLIALRRCG